LIRDPQRFQDTESGGVTHVEEDQPLPSFHRRRAGRHLAPPLGRQGSDVGPSRGVRNPANSQPKAVARSRTLTRSMRMLISGKTAKWPDYGAFCWPLTGMSW